MPEKAGIAYSINGGGMPLPGCPPLVLIHGAGGQRYHWPPHLRRLARIICYGLDLPGHGDSPGGGEEEIEAYLDRLTEWMDVVGLDSAVWAGHSMGGAISIMAALRRPERVAGLILVGTGGRLRVHPSLLESTRQDPLTRQVVDQIMEWSFSSGADPKLVSLAAARMVDVPAAVLHGDFQACDRFDVLDELSAISTPALVICGTEDRLTPVKYSEKLVQDIPNAAMQLVEGSGHMVMLEEPEQVQRAVMDFLAELYSQDG